MILGYTSYVASEHLFKPYAIWTLQCNVCYGSWSSFHSFYLCWRQRRFDWIRLVYLIWNTYDALLFRAFLWREHTVTVLQSHSWIYSFIAEFFSKIVTVIVLHWCATYRKLFFFDCACISSMKRTTEQNNHYSIRLHYVFYVVIYYLSINSKVSYYLVPRIVKK